MAIFKPESSGSFNDYLGICEFGILEFRDKSKDFEWADLFIEILVKQKNSDYDRTIQIKGNLERENGKITGGTVLKRMYHVFEQLGCGAGINVDGEWEDENGDKIEDIARYLNDKFVIANGKTEPNMDYLAYFYKGIPKETGGKSYTRAFNKIYQNNDKNKAQLQSDVTWMKSKGYLKELSDEVQNKTEMSSSGLSNL
tara:strand:- start:839 stop:1432 length:594 start_codon:yes stop_codon:yes gene_type:complete